MDSSKYLSVCTDMGRENIMDCVNKGLDRSLGGPQTRNLVLKALKFVHKLDEKDIPCSLNVFEILMVKMFGKPAASMILNDIANKCRINY